MNGLIVSWLRVGNGLLALSIFIIGNVAGGVLLRHGYGALIQERWDISEWWSQVGLAFLAVACAGFICGPFAAMLEIERHLKEIKKEMKETDLIKVNQLSGIIQQLEQIKRK